MTDILNKHIITNKILLHLVSFELKNVIISNEGISFGIPSLYLFNNGSIFLCINDNNVIWYNLYQK